MAKVWVVTGQSESGDEYGPWVFAEEPTEEQLKQLVSEDEVGADGWDSSTTTVMGLATSAAPCC